MCRGFWGRVSSWWIWQDLTLTFLYYHRHFIADTLSGSSVKWPVDGLRPAAQLQDDWSLWLIRNQENTSFCLFLSKLHHRKHDTLIQCCFNVDQYWINIRNNYVLLVPRSITSSQWNSIFNENEDVLDINKLWIGIGSLFFMTQTWYKQAYPFTTFNSKNNNCCFAWLFCTSLWQ